MTLIHNAGNPYIQNIGRGFFIIPEMSTKYNQIYNSPYSFFDTIYIIYQMPSSDNIKLFGTKFVSHYKNTFKIIHNSIESPIKEYYFLSYDDIRNDDFRIKLKGITINGIIFLY